MHAIHVSIEGLAVLQRGMEQAPEMTRNALLYAMTEATMLTERETRELMPRVSGLTAASIESDAFATPVGVVGTVGSPLPSALFIELGTRPHMPPVDARIPWVRAALGVEPTREREVAWLVARKIAKHGTKAQKPFERAAQAVSGQVARIFETACSLVAEQIATTRGAA